MENAITTDVVGAGVISRPEASDESRIIGKYFVECFAEDGSLKWSGHIDNLITTVGKNDMLDKYLSGSSWSTGTVHMGLKGTGTAAAADTMASHAGWSELSITSTRSSVTFASASAGSKATSTAVSFSITAAGPTTVAGVFIVIGGTSANANTTGTLFSAGDFSSSRSVVSGDTLQVTYTASLT
jgi:hypothetical protein